MNPQDVGLKPERNDLGVVRWKENITHEQRGILLVKVRPSWFRKKKKLPSMFVFYSIDNLGSAIESPSLSNSSCRLFLLEPG